MRGIHVLDDGRAEFSDKVSKPIFDTNSAELYIRVHASSVNPFDWKLARGDYKGLISSADVPGTDFSGVIEQIGTKCDASRGFRVGDEVFGFSDRYGAYAEYLVVSETFLARKPSNLSFGEAASLPMVALTAYQALVHYANVKEAESVLILGGGSGVGHVAIQIAKARGATNIYATCSAEKMEAVRQLGATPIDYKTTNFANVLSDKKLDVVLDVVGDKGDRHRAFDLMRPNGHVITTQPLEASEQPSFLSFLGASADFVWDKTVSALFKSVNYTVFRIDTARVRDDLDRICQLVESKKLKPLVSRIVPLREVQSAWDQSKDMHTLGKIVIDIEKSQA